MKNIFKKALSFFLAVIMTVGMFPVTVFAEEYVYFSISLDDKFVDGKDGTVMARVPVKMSELESIKLADFGLEEYIIDYNADGKEDITALHLDLYAHEKYCDRGADEIAEMVNGGPGSLYFNTFWSGHDCNLNYYVNGEYPLAFEGWGATADVITINPGDFVDIIMMTSWNFCWDAAGGFHYFLDENGAITHKIEAEKDVPVSFNIGRAYGNIMMGGATEIVPETNGAELYYSKDKADMLTNSGSSIFDDDYDGTVSVTFPEAGTWYVWVPGMYGIDIEPDKIVSGPAYAEVTVKGEEAPKLSVTLDKETLSVTEGKTAKLTAAVVPEEKAGELVWSSSDETVATVDQNGVVTGVKVGEATITAKVGEVSAECKVNVTEVKSYLSGLGFYVSVRDANNKPYNMYYKFEPGFSDKVYEYDIYVPDNKARIDIETGLSGNAPEGSKIIAKWTNINTSKPSEKEWKADSFYVNNFIKSKTATSGEFTIEVGVEGDIQTYKFNVKRTPTLGKLAIKDRTGGTVKIDPKTFNSDIAEYSATTGSDEITITADPTVKDTGYTVTFNGSESNVVALAEGENNIEIKVKNAEGLEKTYTLKVTRTPASKVKFSVNPSDAVIFVLDPNRNRMWPNENGEFAFIPGVEYTYNVTYHGYIGKTETVTVSEDTMIMVNLEKAPVTKFTEFESSWPSFGLNEENNIVIDRPTPRTKDETALYWATKVVEVSNIGSESSYNSNPVGVPILINDYLYTYAKDKLFKIDKMSGEILEMGTMTGGTSTFAICSLAYGEGLIFVGLNGGTVQAFNAETLESVWVYRDSLGGQPNGQLSYNDGYLYTGFWNGESKTANYSCISVTDEDPENTKETKLATWSHTQMGGFYWAGAYVDEDYLYIGTDDGSAEGTSTNTHLLSIDKRTGKVIDDVALPGGGDIRCSVTCYEGKLYFTSKGGYFYEAEFDAETGDIGEIRYLKLENGTDYPPMSTSTPTIYNGRAYIGVSGKGQFIPYSGHNITVIDLPSWSIAYSVPTQGYPQTTGTLTTYYEESDGYVYVYFFDNMAPGKLRVLADRPGVTEPLMTIEETSNGKTYTVAASVFEPAEKMAQYCICTPIIDKDGTLYFKNDSGHLFAVGSAVEYIEVTKNPDKMSYEPGEFFDPAGMEVTAYYMNGTERDITDYVTYSTEPLERGDENFMIVYENVGSDEKPYDIININIRREGVLELIEEKEGKKTKISLTDTIKLDNSVDTPEVYFADKPAGGVFYIGIVSDKEYDKLELHTTGYLKGQLIDFDPEKYRSIGETYCVIHRYTDEIADKEVSSRAAHNIKATKMTYEKAKQLAEKLNRENKTTVWEVKCEQYVYVAKITVPENYGVSYKSGTYQVTAEKDGLKYASGKYTVVSDVSIFEYEYLKSAAMYENNPAEVMSENARGYSDYLTAKYGYGNPKYNPAPADKPTVVSTTAFRAIAEKELVLTCGDGVEIIIPKISTMQRGVNFIYKNSVPELDSGKKATSYSLNFYGKQPIQSDFVIEWNLGVNAFELRESFKIKIEEEDIITYYILKDGKYFDEFTVDYMTDDIGEDIVLILENEGGTTLGNYSITTKRPADADFATDDSEEFNPNTGAPIF